jgi:ribosome maturation factor RimP
LQIGDYFCILCLSSPASIAGLFFDFDDMSSILLEKLIEIATPIVEQHQAFFVEMLLRGEKTGKIAELFVDTDTGISLDLCSQISREFAQALDTADIIQGRYRLDVSSPGLSRPLKVKRQYRRHIGFTAKVSFIKDGTKISVEGKLEEVGETAVVLFGDGRRSTIAFDEIVETVIIPKMKK